MEQRKPNISCCLVPGPETPEHVALAEELGYQRAWLCDSSTLYDDVWATLALAAQRTERIGLGTGIAVASLRHVTVTASAVATIERLAPGRVVLGLGAGGTGMMMLGRRPVPWGFVAPYAEAVRHLLQGEAVEWEGAEVRLEHPTTGVALPERDIPIVIAAEGPRGERAARDHGDGIFTIFHQPEANFDWSCRMVHGSVLEQGESPTSERVVAAAGPCVAPIYHFSYMSGNRAAIEALPGGAAWAAEIDALPAAERTRAAWAGHLVRLSGPDSRHIPAEFIAENTYTGTGEEVRERVTNLASAHGFTEIVYGPSGPDIQRELRAFAAATL
jgi:5,10-methylenetetrahydromethanopterin reductase